MHPFSCVQLLGCTSRGLECPLTTPGAAAGFSSLAAVVTAYLSGKSLLVSFQTAAPQTLRVSHGLPRRSPSGRRRAHSSCQTGQTSQTSQTGQTQAPHHRDPHTTVAIKKPRISQRHIFARVIPNSGTANPQGITWLATA